ncbi:MAG TPA: fumarylacetoacetate hydrolase family protein [Conexibacter sp.]|jgi:2-oxopent-4-enoate hydratase
MTPTETEIPALAGELARAETQRVAVPPLTARHPTLTVEDAYAIQEHNTAAKIAAGDPLVGRKIGLTSGPMQRLLGVNEPDFGALFASMRAEDGDAMDVDALLQPRVEAELAFVMAQDLAGPNVDALAAARAIAGVAPALEIIDSRVADWKIRLVDTVADNGSSGRFVVAPTLTPLAGIDLRLIGCVLTRNGELADTGAGAAALGNPLRCVAWLANKLGEFGQGLRAGDVVLSGALHAAVDVQAGQTVRAEFARLGAVSIHFTTRQGGDS